ncbi:MAG: hypothetical protein AAF533_24730 [Acidobacteriota bacterium]
MDERSTLTISTKVALSTAVLLILLGVTLGVIIAQRGLTISGTHVVLDTGWQVGPDATEVVHRGQYRVPAPYLGDSAMVDDGVALDAPGSKLIITVGSDLPGQVVTMRAAQGNAEGMLVTDAAGTTAMKGTVHDVSAWAPGQYFLQASIVIEGAVAPQGPVPSAADRPAGETENYLLTIRGDLITLVPWKPLASRP